MSFKNLKIDIISTRFDRMLWALETISCGFGIVVIASALCLWSVGIFYVLTLLSKALDAMGYLFVRWAVPSLLKLHLFLSGKITEYLLYTMREIQ